VIAATIAVFALGALWYSPVLFVKVWQREARVGGDPAKAGNLPLLMAGSFVLTFLATLVFALFLGPEPGWRFGAAAGFAAGLFWVAGSLGINYLFEGRSFTLWLINGGYNVAMFTVMGTVLGLIS
jgi:hypothetical protein